MYECPYSLLLLLIGGDYYELTISYRASVHTSQAFPVNPLIVACVTMTNIACHATPLGVQGQSR